MKNLQQAADDVGAIAETVETLQNLLDKFHANHGEELYDRIVAVWPEAYRIGNGKQLYDLAQRLTPPED